MKASKIADMLKYEYVGENDIEVDSIKMANVALESDIAVAKSYEDIVVTKAKVILSNMAVVIGKCFIYTHENIEMASIKIAQVINENQTVNGYENSINCVYGNNVSIGCGTKYGNYCVFGNNVVIGNNCVIGDCVSFGDGTIVGDNVIIDSGAQIGGKSNYHYIDENGVRKRFFGCGITQIANGVEIGYNTVIQRGTFNNTLIGDNTKIGNLVEIAHDVVVGENCKIISQTGIAGGVIIGRNVVIYGQCGIKENVVIGDGVVIKGKSRVTKNIPAGLIISGMHTRENKKELTLQVKLANI